MEKVKVETENINKLLLNIPAGNITEIKELIYAGETKLVCDKIDVFQKNSKRKTKPRRRGGN